MARPLVTTVLAVLIVPNVACSNDAGTATGAIADSSTRDGPLPRHDASIPKPDAGKSRRNTDAGSHNGDAAKPRDAEAHHDAAAPRDAALPDATRPAGGGRPLGTNRNDFFGPSRCAAAHVELCEDFESGAIDSAIWQTVGSPTIDGAQRARGQKALHVLMNGNGPEYIRERKTFPAANNSYWGRIFVNFAHLPTPAMGYAHWTFAAASGTGVSGEIRLSGQLSNGSNRFGVGTDNRTDPEGTGDWTMTDEDQPGNPVPQNQWLCIEWQHSGTSNETRFFVDGVEHPSLHTTATQNGGNGKPYILPTFDNVWVGWQEYQTSTETFELWIDEVAIDGARIGCII